MAEIVFLGRYIMHFENCEVGWQSSYYNTIIVKFLIIISYITMVMVGQVSSIRRFVHLRD